ncbi:hypothetical protein AVEN_234819-1 [Araneus ventricosus]|uniref:Uncharacterized protein n=1 Tax=Araneus ventricosus TaxID=182803 RepID=A0A4Y2F869_ARAVE|nr:hypothetical protein AVEN_234819-1 [Araneus ventricosus]
MVSANSGNTHGRWLPSLVGLHVTVSPHESFNSSKGVVSCGELFNVPIESILKGLPSQGVPESNKTPSDFSDFKTVTNRKKLKKVSQVNQDSIIVDKVSRYYNPPQLTDKEHSKASNSVIKQGNVMVTKNGTKSAHVCCVGPVPDSMAAFPPEKTKVLQSLESDADAEMRSSSASEGDTLEYDMYEDLEDKPQNICPTTLPPPSTAAKR